MEQVLIVVEEFIESQLVLEIRKSLNLKKGREELLLLEAPEQEANSTYIENKG